MERRLGSLTFVILSLYHCWFLSLAQKWNTAPVVVVGFRKVQFCWWISLVLRNSLQRGSLLKSDDLKVLWLVQKVLVCISLLEVFNRPCGDLMSAVYLLQILLRDIESLLPSLVHVFATGQSREMVFWQIGRFWLAHVVRVGVLLLYQREYFLLNFRVVFKAVLPRLFQLPVLTVSLNVFSVTNCKLFLNMFPWAHVKNRRFGLVRGLELSCQLRF